MSASLAVPTLAVDPTADVRLAWDGLAADTLGVPPAPVVEALFTSFRSSDAAAIADGLVAGTLSQSATVIQFLCAPTDDACRFSEFEVSGHDFRVADSFGADDATWLLSLWGADADGIVGLAFVTPDGATGEARYGAPPAAVGFGSVDAAEDDVEMPAGVDLDLDWAALTRDTRGRALDPARIDAAALIHLDVDRDEVPARLEAETFAGAALTRLPVADSVSLGELGRPDGLDAEGTWLLALFVSADWAPVPVYLGVLSPG